MLPRGARRLAHPPPRKALAGLLGLRLAAANLPRINHAYLQPLSPRRQIAGAVLLTDTVFRDRSGGRRAGRGFAVGSCDSRNPCYSVGSGYSRNSGYSSDSRSCGDSNSSGVFRSSVGAGSSRCSGHSGHSGCACDSDGADDSDSADDSDALRE